MFHVPEKCRHRTGAFGSDEKYGNNGLFWVNYYKTNVTLKVIASDGMGWEHVSVSLPNRNPNWDEMCFIKELFWDDEDCAVQYHPPKSEYVNCHPHCLHLWRPTEGEIILPPSICVGPNMALG